MINNTTIICNLGQDPETRFGNSGKQVTTFNGAFSTFKKDQTHWIKIVAFDGTAKLASEWLSKGDRVAISGYLEESTWEKQGVKQSRIQLVARTIEFIKIKKSSNNEQPQQVDTSTPITVYTTPDFDDDIPF